MRTMTKPTSVRQLRFNSSEYADGSLDLYLHLFRVTSVLLGLGQLMGSRVLQMCHAVKYPPFPASANELDHSAGNAVLAA
jgi:hypothetical protein